MVDCRSLIEFCRAFEQHRQAVNPQASLENRSNQSHGRSNNKFIYNEASELFPVAVDLVGEVVCPSFVAYAIGSALMLITGVALWGVLSHQFRKCGNPKCRGLRKAVEFDIQLESEECVRFMPVIPKDAFGSGQLELGKDHKELEAELKKMAPLNGRTVLIFRSPCGCPIGRMEVWGQKKVRRIKK